MPSGSHGGHSHSGGSRVSGGSRSSGGAHFGGFHGGTRSYPRRPFRLHFWGHYYVVPTRFSGVISLLSVVLIFALFFIFAGWIMSAQAQSDLAAVERDYELYQAMIANTATHPELLVTGTIMNHYYDEVADKWYLTYSFYTQHGDLVDNGESFSMYTLADLAKPGYSDGDAIMIAINRVSEYQGDIDINSIPMDYKNFALTDDGRYVAYQGTYRVGRIMLIIASCAAGAMVVLNIVIVCVTKKKADADGNVLESPTTTAGKTAAASAPKYCSYCGVKIGENDTKCPGCGARVP